MKIHPYLSTGLTAGALLLTGTLALAQTTPAAGTADKTKAAATTTVQPRDAASGQASGRRQDQYGQASGIAADHTGGAVQAEANSKNSAHASESLQKKHIAGVKYEDRVRPGNKQTQKTDSSEAPAPTPAPKQ